MPSPRYARNFKFQISDYIPSLRSELQISNFRLQNPDLESEICNLECRRPIHPAPSANRYGSRWLHEPWHRIAASPIFLLDSRSPALPRLPTFQHPGPEPQ